MWMWIVVTAILSGLAVWLLMEWRAVGPLYARCSGLVKQNLELSGALNAARRDAVALKVRIDELTACLQREMAILNAARVANRAAVAKKNK